MDTLMEVWKCVENIFTILSWILAAFFVCASAVVAIVYVEAHKTRQKERKIRRIIHEELKKEHASFFCSFCNSFRGRHHVCVRKLLERGGYRHFLRCELCGTEYEVKLPVDRLCGSTNETDRETQSSIDYFIRNGSW